MIEAVQAVRERALRATAALEQAGSPYAMAGEKVRDSYPIATADVTERVTGEDYSVVSLEALVRMKLNSFRTKDRMYLIDMLELGLIDATWLPRLIPEHATRLQQLLDNPE